MKTQTIIVTVHEDASFDVDLNGFEGQGCDAIAKAFTDALGSETSHTHKPEWKGKATTRNAATATATAGTGR